LGIQTPSQLITLVLYVLKAQPLAVEFPKVRVHPYRPSGYGGYDGHSGSSQ
ncbi:hypothetical protein HAX54_028149, partial [Datura stramonium]|nr:hypothetical protein [Datura stramonium]